jgi:hypothetical protein
MPSYHITILLNPERRLVATAMRLDTNRHLTLEGVSADEFDVTTCVLPLGRHPEPHDTVHEVRIDVDIREPDGRFVVFLHEQLQPGRMPSPPIAGLGPYWFEHRMQTPECPPQRKDRGREAINGHWRDAGASTALLAHARD